ncbi:MAG: YbgC/FadM family acyl-CoA thioesterase, partial [Spirochaetia bacterium]|nr:YbgC/FadM family acyl-CoA thioesterase [Spirochaetia bacterium]
VYYSDTDCGGIVYHGRYLDFAEHARTELLREVARSRNLEGSQTLLLKQDNLAFVVKSITVDYQKPAYLDDLLEVETEIEQQKRFSLTFRQTIWREQEILCVLLVKVASINTLSLRPIPMPDYFSSYASS